jgi:predicted transcriptional regulator
MRESISLPKSLQRRLEEVSRTARKTPATIVREAVSDRIAYLEWEAAALAQGQADLDAGLVVSTAELRQALSSQRSQRARKSS